jgi:hypothetical protein
VQQAVPVACDDGNGEVVGGFAVHEHLTDQAAAQIDVLHLIRRHVLSLRQLEDVLLAVDQPDGYRLRVDFDDVSSLQPSVSSDRLLRQLVLLVVAQKHVSAPHPQLAPWSYHSLLVAVLRCVLHLWDFT